MSASLLSASPLDGLRRDIATARAWSVGSRSYNPPLSSQAQVQNRHIPVINPRTLKKVNLHAAIVKSARSHGLPPALLATMVKIESNGDPCAHSSAGAKGLGQLMDATARAYKVSDSFKPYMNLNASSQMIKELLDRYDGKLLLVGAAYNAGDDVLTRLWQDWPLETQRYLRKIVNMYPAFARHNKWREQLPMYVVSANRALCSQ